MKKVLFIARASQEFCHQMQLYMPNFWDNNIRVEVLFTEGSNNDIAAANIVFYDLWVHHMINKGFVDNIEEMAKYEPLVKLDDVDKPRADICSYNGDFAGHWLNDFKVTADLIKRVLNPDTYEKVFIDIALTNLDKYYLMHKESERISSIHLYGVIKNIVDTQLYTLAIVPTEIVNNWSDIWLESYGTMVPYIITKAEDLVDSI